MRFISLLAVTGLAIAVFGACSGDAVGVDACRRIETARCQRAAGCGISLGTPLHEKGDPETDVTACVRFYRDACLHGLVATAEPGGGETDACVNVILTGDCTVVKQPEIASACSFLAVPDAGAAVVDAGSDVSDATGQ
ncbi:MAG: hypothetical protein HOO96_29170 [Polyangiaceae bacterium]|jgi:hypothetical protein|nr:hypothetical protein [Polyangiaceae bacterium]